MGGRVGNLCSRRLSKLGRTVLIPAPLAFPNTARHTSFKRLLCRLWVGRFFELTDRGCTCQRPAPLHAAVWTHLSAVKRICSGKSRMYGLGGGGGLTLVVSTGQGDEIQQKIVQIRNEFGLHFHHFQLLILGAGTTSTLPQVRP